ncbi:MAG: trypsin-like peptidase domain-containing protein [Clostridiales bacterium]|nr:trypsin-like peptidase domain-containing protein [Clostridiales bacterium]
MKKIIIVLIAILLAIPSVGFGENTDVDVMIPSYDVKVNGVKIDTAHSQYPVLVYKGVTYFPMTSDYLSGIGLDLKFSNAEGLKISKKNDLSDLVQMFLGADNELGSHVKAQIPAFGIGVNGKVIDNSTEEYPILSYKNITYFPMTWRFAVTEFGWKTTWSNTEGFGINIVKEVVNERKKLTTTEIGELTDAVVKIEVSNSKGETASGSGFFYNNEGGIVTNSHVILGAEKITIIDNNGKKYTTDINVKGYSLYQDLAIIDTKIENSSHLKMVDETLKIGNDIYAIGSPYGLTNTLSEGIVSAIDKRSIQVTAAVSPGSSGGPLLNEYGECVGVIVAGIKDGENIGMAIPSRMVINLNKKSNFTIKEFYTYVKNLDVIETEDGLYIGETKNKEFNGNGEFADINGHIYIGEFKDSKLEGKGTFYYASGSIFSGSFVNDDPEYGTYTYYNDKEGNVIYTGPMKDWDFHGKGKLIESDGSVYLGDFVDGTKEGTGKYTLANGDVYEGGFKDDEYNGQGSLNYSNGGSYVGGWSNGLRAGFGTYTYSNGDVKSGNWENNELVE